MLWLRLTYIVLNVVVALLLAPLLHGIERKVKAKVQNRIGPPILQTIYDLSKLYRRAPIGYSIASWILISMSFSYALILTLLVPTAFNVSLGFTSDLVLVIYLLTSTSVLMALAAIAGASPYSGVGSSREASLVMAIELVIAFIIGTLAVSYGVFTLPKLLPIWDLGFKPSVLGALTLLAILTYIEGLRLPFDIPEAEPEIASGVYVDFSGRILAAALHTHLLRRLLVTSLFIDFLLPREWFYFKLGGYLIDLSIVPYLIIMVLASVIYAVTEALFGRYRIDAALKLLKAMAIMSLGVMVLAFAGY